MKINEIYINAFGGVSNFSLAPNDGLNVIFGENENGKTTVMTFIRAMFYGLSNKKGKSIGQREKYTPWTAGIMGGRISFTKGGTNYTLEREFKNSDSADRVVLTNKDTGEILKCDKNIGTEFFGISEEAFIRSTFIDNDTVFTFDSASGGELNHRLAEISGTGNTEITQDKIVKNLTNAKNKMRTKTGNGGTLQAEIAELKALKEKLESNEASAEERAKITAQIEEENKVLSALLAQKENCDELLSRENDIKNTEKLNTFIEKNRLLEECNKDLTCTDGSVIGEMFIKTVELGLADCEKQQSKCDDLKAEIEQMESALKEPSLSPEEAVSRSQELQSEIDELKSSNDALSQKIENKTAEYEAAKQEGGKSKGALNLPLFISALVILAGAGVLFFLSQKIIAAALAAVGIILLILSFIIKSGKSENDLSELGEEIVTLREEKAQNSERLNNSLLTLNQITSEMKNAEAVKAQREKDISLKQDALADSEKKLDAAKARLFDYFKKYKECESNDDIKSTILSLKEPLERQKELKIELKMLSADLGGIDLDTAKAKLGNMSDSACDSVDFSSLKEKDSELNEKITESKEKISALASALKNGFRDFTAPETLKREIAQAQEDLNDKIRFCDAVDIANEVLGESAVLMRKNYGGTLEKTVTEIFSKLTAGKYSNVSLDNNMQISAEETDSFGMRSLAFLSKGTADQAYLSLRLALSELLASDEPLPIMLDDSLSQYDDRRLKTAMEFLKEYSEKHQILLFTCHGTVCDTSAALGVEPEKL